MTLFNKISTLLLSKAEKKICHQILHRYNAYYKALSSKNQHQFKLRTLLFINEVNFNASENFEINFEKKVIIASGFIQITFGYKSFELNHFKQIFIAANSYSYSPHKVLFDGDVNIKTKQVSLSWPAILKGFHNTEDALNLAIHEFGHCLLFENMFNTFTEKYFDEWIFEEWKKLAHIKLNKIRAGNNVVLRDYGGTNLIELFSVALEAFFETPHKFNTHEPNLYNTMVQLLNQDPRNKLHPIVISS